MHVAFLAAAFILVVWRPGRLLWLAGCHLPAPARDCHVISFRLQMIATDSDTVGEGRLEDLIKLDCIVRSLHIYIECTPFERI